MNKSSDSNPLPLISRRALLKLFGVGTVAGLLGYSRFSKPQPTVFQQDALDLPERLRDRKTVTVVGAGLAGLACAYELSQRGFAVTLLERSAQLGGKIASWSIQVNGENLRMEHGFHGFFPQYYNLNNLVEELAIRDHFRSLEFYSVMYRGQRYLPEVFHPSHSAFPWNIVDLAMSSPNRWRWGLNLTHPAHWQVFREITGFQVQSSFQRLDGLSVADWVKQDFPRGLYDLYFLPFARSTLNAPDVLSAGELMQFFHFYFFGNPEGLAFYGTRQDMGRSLVDPIADAIERNGGQIRTDVTVSQVNWQHGEIQSLDYQANGTQSTVPFWVERNPLLSTEELEYFGAGDAVFVLPAGSKEAIALSCPHQGCTVERTSEGKFKREVEGEVEGEVVAESDFGFRCPCHGAAFDASGQVLRGPAQRDLTRFAVVQRQAERLQLVAQAESAAPTETIANDYYVFATDVPGVQQLFSLAVGELNMQIAEQVEQLAIADPFAVARFWFDRDFPWQQSLFTSLSGYALTDSITLYHRIQEDYIDWAKRTGGSVVELHAYGYKEKDFPTQQVLLTTFEQELYEIVPTLQNATMLHRELVNQKNFSGYPPNSNANRPTSRTAATNLVFAGDWVKMPFPCGLMERAVSSGLLAANTIFQQEGLRRRPLLSVNPEGVFSSLAPRTDPPVSS